MFKGRPYYARESGRLRCPDCGGRGGECPACHGSGVIVLYRCPKCNGNTKGPGDWPPGNVCEVCLGNRTVNLEIMDVYQREGLEGYRRWMREILTGTPDEDSPDNQD